LILIKSRRHLPMREPAIFIRSDLDQITLTLCDDMARPYAQ
jgi:hypothetical protein